MNGWEQDRRRGGGAGWILDESGDWVPSSGQPATPAAPAATPRAMAASAPARAPRRTGAFLRAAMTAFVLPAVAAAGVIYVWKGPGGEIALSRIEPLVASLLAPETQHPPTSPEVQPTYPVHSSNQPRETRDAAPVPGSHALPDGNACASVRRGMGNGIVFHRAGDCPD